MGGISQTPNSGVRRTDSGAGFAVRTWRGLSRPGCRDRRGERVSWRPERRRRGSGLLYANQSFFESKPLLELFGDIVPMLHQKGDQIVAVDQSDTRKAVLDGYISRDGRRVFLCTVLRQRKMHGDRYTPCNTGDVWGFIWTLRLRLLRVWVFGFVLGAGS